MKKIMSLTILLAAVMSLAACSTSQEKLLPRGDQTMLDLWQKKSGSGNLIPTRQNVAQDPVRAVNFQEQESYTRTAENEITNLFPRLPNPDLVMYIFPHLSDTAEPMPVPGYSTVIPFYSRVQYAQAGERLATY